MPHHPDSAPAFALFDDNLDASSAGAWLLTGLVEEIRCTDPDAWPAALARLEKAAKDGAWVALAARYELGYAIEPRLRPLLPAGDEALVTGWIFAHGEWLSDAAVDAWLAKMAGDAPGGAAESWQHIEVDRIADPARSDALRGRIEGPLDDVRVSVADWPRMVERAPEAMYLTHYGPVSDVPRLAQSLYEQIDAMVAIADGCDGRADRHRCIAAALSALYLERAHAQQVPLADEDVLRLLAMDIELNAQGLGVWLDRGRP